MPAIEQRLNGCRVAPSERATITACCILEWHLYVHDLAAPLGSDLLTSALGSRWRYCCRLPAFALLNADSLD